MLKIFVSQPMKDLSNEQIMEDHERIVSKLQSIFGNDIEIRWGYSDEPYPEGAGRLYGWGKGLEAMDGCDIFCNCENARGGAFNGCQMERMAASMMGMTYLELSMDDIYLDSMDDPLLVPEEDPSYMVPEDPNNFIPEETTENDI